MLNGNADWLSLGKLVKECVIFELEFLDKIEDTGLRGGDTMMDFKGLGKMIKLLRQQAGLTQEKLIEIIGDDRISLSTLKRIEKGEGHINMAFILEICSALGKNLSELMGNVEWSQITKCQVDSEHEMREMQDYLERQWLFYPQPTNPTFYECYPIRTLMMFLVYLPLMDWEKILGISWRICGCMFEQEVYVLTQLWELYEGIPDGKAKRYADYAARKCTYNYFYAYYTSDHAETDRINEEFGSIEKMQECFAEYRSIIENRWYSAGGPKLYREDGLRKALRESE